MVLDFMNKGGNGQLYNVIITGHGVIMLLFMVMPVLSVASSSLLITLLTASSIMNGAIHGSPGTGRPLPGHQADVHQKRLLDALFVDAHISLLSLA